MTDAHLEEGENAPMSQPSEAALQAGLAAVEERLFHLSWEELTALEVAVEVGPDAVRAAYPIIRAEILAELGEGH